MELFNVYPLNGIEITRAQGSMLWDKNGVEYLDMYGGHAVISIGHTNKHYVKKISEQLNNIGFYSNSVIIPGQKELANKLSLLTGKTDYQLFLCNSGAEANENALKVASFATKRKKVVTFTGAFHGRTSLAVSITDNPSIAAPINDTNHVISAPFNDSKALRGIFQLHSHKIAAVIVEGIQGVGGIKVATPEFLKTIRELCDQSGAQFVADSVQCGCGRTGTYFSHDQADIQADIYTMAKGIGNGFPIGAVLIAPHLKPKYGMLGTTFGGNHLACAAAIAVADEMIEHNLMENAQNMGQYLLGELRKLPQVNEVRGKGLMIGIELFTDSTNIRNRMLSEHHIFVGSASNKKIIRLLPALNITKENCDRTIAALRDELHRI